MDLSALVPNTDIAVDSFIRVGLYTTTGGAARWAYLNGGRSHRR